MRLSIVIPLDARDAVNAALEELCGAAAANTFDVEVFGDDGVAVGYVCSWDLGATGFGDLVEEIQATVEKTVAETKLPRGAVVKEATVVPEEGNVAIEMANVVADVNEDPEVLSSHPK